MPLTKYPKLCHFKPKNLACIWWKRERVYLGPWGSAQAADAYARIIQEIQAGNTAHIQPETPREQPVVRVRDLAAAYEQWARGYFIKRGRPTKYALHIARVRSLLAEKSFDHQLLSGLTVGWLREFRAALVSDRGSRFSRETVNSYTAIVLGMVHWGEEYELTDSGIHDKLKIITPLRRGRPAVSGGKVPREGERRTAAPRAWVQAARRKLPPMLRVMVDLQLLTGARPGELCALKPCHLDRTRHAALRVYRVDPDANKTEIHARDRVLVFGPRAMRLLAPWLAGVGDGDYVFTPAKSEEARQRLRRAGRKTPRWQSHGLEAREERRRRRGVIPAADLFAEHVRSDSYRTAVLRACRIAAREQAARGVPEAERCGQWSPYQLRHNAATKYTERLGMEEAKRLLGHASLTTTINYVHTIKHAERAALKLG